MAWNILLSVCLHSFHDPFHGDKHLTNENFINFCQLNFRYEENENLHFCTWKDAQIHFWESISIHNSTGVFCMIKVPYVWRHIINLQVWILSPCVVELHFKAFLGWIEKFVASFQFWNVNKSLTTTSRYETVYFLTPCLTFSFSEHWKKNHSS